MKKRQGFVSNSSSSSFIVAVKPQHGETFEEAFKRVFSELFKMPKNHLFKDLLLPETVCEAFIKNVSDYDEDNNKNEFLDELFDELDGGWLSGFKENQIPAVKSFLSGDDIVFKRGGMPDYSEDGDGIEPLLCRCEFGIIVKDGDEIVGILGKEGGY